MEPALIDKILAAPKADLHVHLEGTIEPEMIFALAARNGVALPYADVESLRAAYDFADLGAFLSLFYVGLTVMLTRQDFYDVTWAFLERSARENVVYAEVHVAVQSHVERGLGWAPMMDGILSAMADGKARLGIDARPILGVQRHRSEETALETIEQALPWRSDFAGFGMGGAERGNPPSKFVNAFRRARELGWRCTCHAGEEGSAEYVAEALDLLKVERIDHGVRAIDDPLLVARLAQGRVPMTVCPYSNLRLKVDTSLGASALGRLLAAGCNVSVNTDDPSYFGAWLNRTLVDTGAALSMDEGEIGTILRNGFDGAFCAEAEKQTYLAAFDAHWRRTR